MPDAVFVLGNKHNFVSQTSNLCVYDQWEHDIVIGDDKYEVYENAIEKTKFSFEIFIYSYRRDQVYS